MLPEIVCGWDSRQLCARVSLDGCPCGCVQAACELDPQGFHRRVMGQCGQSNNCFPSLAVSFGTDLKGSESILLNFNHHPPTTPQALPITYIFFYRGGRYLSFF